MEKGMKQIFKILVFFLVLGVLCVCAYRILSWKDTTGDYLSSLEQLYQTPENTMDVVFVGSSHCYCSIYPAYFWMDEGIAAFDMAVSGQDKASSYHTLVEVLKTQSPKVVCVDMYGLLFDRHAIEGNEYRNMLSMKPSRNSVELVREYVEPEKQMDFILRWPIIHTRYWELGKYDYVPYEPSTFGRGARYQWKEALVEAGYPDEEGIAELEEANLAWLKRLEDLSRKENFELIFFVAPFYISKEEQQIMNAAAVFAEQEGIPFLDFNKKRKELDLKDDKDFVEIFHVNGYGARKITRFFCSYLKENYDLQDRRGQKGYELWDKDLEWFRHLEFAALFGGNDPYRYVIELKTGENLLSVISIEGISEDELGDYMQSLRHLGFSEEDLLRGGRWIFREGSLTKIMENDPSEKEYRLDLSDSDSLRVRYTGRREANDIMINYTEYLNPEKPVSIVTYDCFLHDLICGQYF
ncbi:MAG: hypothetical protein J5898_03045 [Lachnospiraceae bacterium]|nr:hypothetical protein [Lachnospiraceae bacterium]